MTLRQFLAAHEGVMKAQQIYADSLPEWVRMWMTWMGIVFASAVLFAIWKDEARVVLVSVLLSLLASYWIGYFLGWNRLWGLAHVIFWTPALYWLVRWWPTMQFRPRIGGKVRELTPVFRAWGAVTIATMAVSLVFDYIDVVRFFAG